MHFRVITRFVAILILFLGISMVLPMSVSLFYEDGSTSALLISLLISCFIGLIFFLLTKKKQDNPLSHRDGIAIVTLGWIMAGFFGTLP